MSRALLADIGGTNARFALLEDGQRTPIRRLATAAYPDAPSAFRAACQALEVDSIDAVAVCAAGPPENGAIVLTNAAWSVREDELRAATGASRVVLVNDFTALAHALGHLSDTELDRIGGGTAIANAPRVVLGPGTGLGVSALVPGAASDVAICGEGGHVDLAAANADEARLIETLRERHAHVSAEHVLSGPGLANLYAALAKSGPPPAPETIATLSRDGDPHARAALAHFARFLGTVAGNLALTFGARGGIYVAGGIVPALGDRFDRAAFRTRFEDRGRQRAYVARIPTWVVTAEAPAMQGLAALLEATAASS